MFLTGVSFPAGYGYSEIASEANKNIIPDMIKHFRTEDEKDNGAPIFIHHICIYVSKATKLSVNGRAPIMVAPENPLEFDCSSINSLVFKESGVNYNIIATY